MQLVDHFSLQLNNYVGFVDVAQFEIVGKKIVSVYFATLQEIRRPLHERLHIGETVHVQADIAQEHIGQIEIKALRAENPDRGDRSAWPDEVNRGLQGFRRARHFDHFVKSASIMDRKSLPNWGHSTAAGTRHIQPRRYPPPLAEVLPAQPLPRSL